jgi:hypothetical protein
MLGEAEISCDRAGVRRLEHEAHSSTACKLRLRVGETTHPIS